MIVYVVVDACYTTFKGVFRKKKYAEEYIQEMISEGKRGGYVIYEENI